MPPDFTQEMDTDIADLESAANLLTADFVAKEDVVQLMITCAMAEEHLLIVGPPGTGKSELVKRFALLCSPDGSRQEDGRIPYFEYLLTRFTEPAEIFGPVDLKAFQSGGGHRRIVDGMLPRAEIAFLDEVFKANSAILNALLTVLNERVFYNGGRPERVPLLCAIGATNEVPDDPTLAALFDRFLVRVYTDNVEEARFDDLFHHGWRLQRERIAQDYRLALQSVTSTATLRRLYRALDHVTVDAVAADYREAIRLIRAEGVALSDRRVVTLLKLIAAAALRRRSLEASTADFWVLKHVWNNPEQIPHLERIVNPYLARDPNAGQVAAERSLDAIEASVEDLKGRQARLHGSKDRAGRRHPPTDAEFADFLQQADRLRSELLKHSNTAGAQSLRQQVEDLIEGALQLMDQQA